MIKQIKEINFPKYATLSQAKVSINDMGDMSISAQVKIDGDIKPNFSFDWEVEFNGERYIQPYRSPQGTKDTSSASSTLELTFYHKAEWLMRSQMFIEMASTDSGTVIADKYEASLGLSLEDFVTAFNKVLNHFFGGRIVMLLNPDGTYSSERKFVSISYSYIWDVLQKMNEIYDVRWRIKTDSETGVFHILVGYPADDVSHIFKYGFDGGLMSVQRQVQSSDIRNRLLGRGGEKNLPAYYFKQAPEDSLFESDPDWIPELANIYFSNLRGKTFRDYVKGWKAKHYGGEAMAEPTEAYTAGYTDAKFDPVEYVDDKDSIAKYGVIIGGLDNNEDIYPSIQGAEGGVDIIVDAEQVTDDDTEKAAESESQTVNINGDSAKAQNVPKNTEVTLKMNDSVRHRFTVPDGYTGYVQIGPVSYTALNIHTSSVYGRNQIDISAAMVQQSLTTRIFNASTGSEIARDKFSNLDPGEYYWTQEITLLNASDYAASIVNVTFNGLKLTLGSGEVGGWTPTFDIWVKNIWGTEKLSTESDKDYADRVWLPILGDRLGNEAKVVFSSGWLSFSSDWEFTIVGYAYDTSKEGSEWRLTLQKSDAEQEATGKFIPNEGTNAAAGDSFFFIGIDMPYKYVLWAEQRLDDYKKDQLAELAQINPTWVVETDKVRLNQAESEGGTLADSLSAGCSLRLTDKRFIDSAYLNLYVQTISYEWNESTVINPDIEIVLSDKPSPVINAVSQIQGDIEELNKNVTSLSSIKAEILAAVDQMYLRKDGLNDLSLSQTEFRNLINGLGFRPGRIGGSGWGIYRDSVGKAVGEFDRIVVRDSIDVSSISAEQVKQTSGTKIFSEASIVCTDVVEMSTVYRCYFDTKGGELSNMFKTGDIAWCLKYNPDSSQLKYYKRRVTSVGTDYINLSKTDKDGDGVPEYGDSIVQFGSFTDTSRQSAIILNPHDGGSIVVYAGLNAYEITGRNMVGLGFSKETGKAFLYGYGEFFIGDRTLQGNFITFQQKEGETEPNLYVNGNIIIGAGSSGLTNLSEWADKQAQIDSALADSAAAKLAADNALSTAEGARSYIDSTISPEIEEINRHLDGVVSSWFYPFSPASNRLPASNWTTDAEKLNHVGDTFTNNQKYISDEATPDAGKSWRWVRNSDGTFIWNPISDSEAIRALQNAAKAQTTADGKAQVFLGTPSGPYDVGDLWSQGSTGDLMICVKARTTSGYSASDWAKAVKYTDDTALKDFIEGDYANEIKALTTQIDGKAQTWYQATDPSNSWDTSEDAAHTGDLWYDTGSGKTYRWDGAQWQEQNVPDEVFDKIDGKAQVFVTQPVPPYSVGDLWVQGPGGDILRCTTSRASGSYTASDWSLASKYTDDSAANAAMELAQQANAAAEDAASAAESAKTDAATAISRLDDMASDEIISAVEKPALVQQSADIVSEYNQIVADCAKYSVTYTAFTTAFNAAIHALDKYTADLTSDTAKESDYDDIAAYYTARQTVLDAIASAAKQLAVEADAKASEAAEKAATLETAVASLEKINDDHYFTIPEKRTVRATMQAITSQKGTSVAYSGTIGRTMVKGDSWKKVTKEEADADSTLSKYVGFYRSQNRTNSTYSTVKLTFTLDADAVVGLQYASYGESSYDYLVFSQLDPSVDLTPDTVSVVGSGNTKGNPDIIFSKTFGMTAGTHTLQIMYMKDVSGSSNLDSGFYRITTEVSEGVNGGLTGSFHTVYGLLTDTIDPDGSLRSTFLNSYFTSLVSGMKNTMHLWEDTVTEFTDGSFRDSMAMWLNRYYDKENELRTLVTEKTVMSDYEYLKKVFGKGEVDLLGGAVLAEAVAVKNTEGEVEGLLNGSDTFSDTTHGKVILAGGIPSGEAELNERVAEAETRIFEDGTIKTKKLEAEAGTFSGELNGASGRFTGKITATSGTIGGFEIQTASLYAYGGTESSNTTMTLGPGQCLYTNKRTGTAAGTVDIKSALGMSVLPATSGVDKIALGAEVSVTTGIASDILIGGYFSASGKMQENSQADFGSHALWLEKGNVAGFRPVARVVTTTQTLSKMDSVIVAKNTSSITLTLPTDAEKGQTYLIIHASTTSLTIKGSSSAPILRISTNSSNTSISSTNREGLLLVFDGSEWTLMYLME